MLQAIQEGTAPTDLLNVRIGQSVELRVHKRLDEDYVSPPPESLSEARDLSGDSAEPPDTIAQVQDILKRAAESKSPQFLDKNEATHAGKAENNIESDAVQSQGKGVPNAEWEVEDLAIRDITFWRTGFTVGDGHLRLYGDPESNKILQSIQEGTAPTDLFNVRIGQPVELRVHKRLDEDYVSPPPESLSEARDLSGDSVLSQRPLSRRHLPDE
ncbi:hypothetical protein FRC15_007811 [Serendipita sp. 397]|nr:hypothetical protein FRC15_007811 [Serendipita sp. 397]